MDEREQRRKVRHRLAILRHYEEVTGNVAQTCRYYGISRPTFYKWLHRYEELGEQGLRDGSSRPLASPNATRGEIVGKIVYLRQHYHFGPLKISMYLRRYHDIEIGHSGVWRILKRLDMNRLPSSQRYRRHNRRWQRYEKPLPGHHVQVDVKFIEPLLGTREALPVHRHRRLHPHPSAADLSPEQSEDRDPVHRLRPREAPVPGGDHPD
jgi:transposase